MQSEFAEAGFLHLKDYWRPCVLEAFENQIADLFFMQAMKIGEYRETLPPRREFDLGEPAEALGRIVEMMEGADKEALYQVQKFFPSCQKLRRLFDDAFMEACAGLLGANPATILIEGPALFVNRPKTERLLYKWHSEGHYYPKRRRFVNVWFPLFSDKHEGNGTMAIKPKSHAKEWPFAEYTGYNKDTEGKRNHFLQFEVPANLHADFPTHHIEAKRGDLILFDRNLIHTSNPNRSSEYSFAVVARVWDPTDDLTLSGNMAVTPYGGDNGGRANLIVRP